MSAEKGCADERARRASSSIGTTHMCLHRPGGANDNAKKIKHDIDTSPFAWEDLSTGRRLMSAGLVNPLARPSGSRLFNEPTVTVKPLLDVDRWHLEVARGHSFCSTRVTHPHPSRFRHHSGKLIGKSFEAN